VIQRAIGELHDYLHRKVKEVRDVEHLMKRSDAFNRRQLALLGYAMRMPDETFTFRSHAQSHGVTHETARNDLAPLVARGLLNRRRVGGKYFFDAPANLPDLLKPGS
jgi:Fic family protein